VDPFHIQMDEVLERMGSLSIGGSTSSLGVKREEEVCLVEEREGREEETSTESVPDAVIVKVTKSLSKIMHCYKKGIFNTEESCTHLQDLINLMGRDGANHPLVDHLKKTCAAIRAGNLPSSDASVNKENEPLPRGMESLKVSVKAVPLVEKQNQRPRETVTEGRDSGSNSLPAAAPPSDIDSLLAGQCGLSVPSLSVQECSASKPASSGNPPPPPILTTIVKEVTSATATDTDADESGTADATGTAEGGKSAVVVLADPNNNSNVDPASLDDLASMFQAVSLGEGEGGKPNRATVEGGSNVAPEGECKSARSIIEKDPAPDLAAHKKRKGLRRYQEAIISEIHRRLSEGDRTILVFLATGGGKTKIGVELIKHFLREGRRSLFIVNKVALVEQTKGAFELEGLMDSVGIINATDEEDRSKAVQIAIMQTLTNRKYPPADLVVVDEAHCACAATYKKLISSYPSSTIFLGLTATPTRMNVKEDLAEVFQTLVQGPSILSLVHQKYLVPAITYGTVTVSFFKANTPLPCVSSRTTSSHPLYLSSLSYPIYLSTVRIPVIAIPLLILFFFLCRS
jgi:hypothetical protein